MTQPIVFLETLVQLVRGLPTAHAIEDTLLAGSPAHARKILRWLRNLQGLEKDVVGWMEDDTPEQQNAKSTELHQLIQTYALTLRDEVRRNPALLKDSTVADANSACQAIVVGLLEHALLALDEQDAQSPKLEALYVVLPESYQLRASQPVRRLLDIISTAIERLSGVPSDARMPIDRLAEMSHRLNGMANTMYSVASMQAPDRAESVELAREILRRLKNLGKDERSMEEMVEVTPLEEKEEFADKVGELVESYRLLLREVAGKHPEILQDPRIQQANETVGGFAHGISIMAKNELPDSSAEAAMIAADMGTMPSSWGSMSKHSVGQMKNDLDKGVEHAAQNAQNMRSEEEQEMATGKGNVRDSIRRRRVSSGQGAAKQVKLMRDLTADDYALQQGRFSQQQEAAKNTQNKSAPTNPLPPGLNAAALAAIKEVGGSLRTISQEASKLAPPEPEKKVSKESKSKTTKTDNPASKNFVQQVKESKKGGDKRNK